MFDGGGFYMGGMHGIWWIVWVPLFAVLLFYIWGRSSEQRGPLNDTPHDVLARRLASGEITPDEYQTRKELLDRDAGMKP